MTLLWGNYNNKTLFGEERNDAIDHSGYVSRDAFKINIGLFTALALVTVTVRIILRLRYMRRILLDDYFLLLAAACLVTGMAILYWQCFQLYLFQALQKDPTRIVVLGTEALDLVQVNKKMQIFMSLNWTAIFAVKFSFLAYFRVLVWNASQRLRTYFCCVAGFTVVTWAFLTASTFIVCPYFGLESLKCRPDRRMDLSIISLTTAIDVITDILVVTFPIIIIHRAHMSRQQKVALGTILSLSLVMVVIAIMRLVGSLLVKGIILDQEWEFFWQQLEASVAVMMGSLTAFRGVFSRGDGAVVAGQSREALVKDTRPRKWWSRVSTTEKRSEQGGDEEAELGSRNGSHAHS